MLTDNQEGMSEDEYFSSIEEHFSSKAFDEDLSEEDNKRTKKSF